MGSNIKLPQPDSRTEVLEVLRAIHRELVALRTRGDEFARSYLNARFPHGKPDDRWPRRRA
jgi:hypothetical protein